MENYFLLQSWLPMIRMKKQLSYWNKIPILALNKLKWLSSNRRRFLQWSTTKQGLLNCQTVFLLTQSRMVMGIFTLCFTCLGLLINGSRKEESGFSSSRTPTPSHLGHYHQFSESAKQEGLSWIRLRFLENQVRLLGPYAN